MPGYSPAYCPSWVMMLPCWACSLNAVFPGFAMHPTVPAFPFLAAAAIMAFAGGVEARDVVDTAVLAGGSVVDTAVQAAHKAAFVAARWIETGYAKRPAVMVGLAGVLLLPVLMIVGAVLYRKRMPLVAPSEAAMPEAAMPDFGGLSAARIELDGAGCIALPAGRDFLQIGRLEDNDICIDDMSVQRYHAVIERADQLGFIITDISGTDGNGLRINGQPCQTALLANGDTVEIGKARMRFATAA